MNYGWIYFCGGGQNKGISSCSTLHFSQIFMLTMFDNVLRVNNKNWQNWQIFTKNVHLRWSWHCLFLLKRWWTWLSETRSRGGGGSAGRLFFSDKRRKTLYFFAFWCVSRHPHPRAQCFQVSAQASANQRPRTTACGLHPGPLKCLVAWALTLKIVPWGGGVGSNAAGKFPHKDL
jgi:hypothetical protein